MNLLNKTRFAFKNLNKSRVQAIVSIVILAVINALIIVSVYMGVMFAKNMDDLYKIVFENSDSPMYVTVSKRVSIRLDKLDEIKKIKTVDYVSGYLEGGKLYCNLCDFSAADKELDISEDVSAYAGTASVILHSDYKDEYSVGDDYNMAPAISATPIYFKVVGFYSSENARGACADLGYINENFGVTDATVTFKMDGFSARKILSDAKRAEQILKNDFSKGDDTDGLFISRSYLTEQFNEMTKTSAIFEAVTMCIGVLCFIISAFSVANSILIICEEAEPLLGLLKACGTTKQQLFSILLIEIAFIMLVAVTLSCLLTLALNTVAVSGVNKFLNLLVAEYLVEYGSVFTISYSFPFWLPPITFVAFIAASIIISRVKIIKLLSVTPKVSLEGGDR